MAGTRANAPTREGDAMQTGAHTGRLAGRVVLITGGGTGIGRAACVLFAREGATVVAIGPEAATLRETAQEVAAPGVAVAWTLGDVRHAEDARRIVDETVARHGRLDVLCNNAGVEFFAPLHETPEDKWDLVVDTNLKGVYQMSRHVIPVMIRQGSGVIVNTASQLAFVGARSYGAYCASKGGVVNLTRAMALDLGPHGIRVNALCPGAVNTPLLRRLFDGGTGPQGTLADLAAMHALRRVAEPEEIARAMLFLASDDSSFMTGSALVVDGGYLAA
jgi:NAD(P)-dependent dehydrogenase (short-subunit alcohol dehydrogenase family)